MRSLPCGDYGPRQPYSHTRAPADLHKIDLLVDSLAKFRDALRIEAKAAGHRRAGRAVRAVD